MASKSYEEALGYRLLLMVKAQSWLPFARAAIWLAQTIDQDRPNPCGEKLISAAAKFGEENQREISSEEWEAIDREKPGIGHAYDVWVQSVTFLFAALARTDLKARGIIYTGDYPVDIANARMQPLTADWFVPSFDHYLQLNVAQWINPYRNAIVRHISDETSEDVSVVATASHIEVEAVALRTLFKLADPRPELVLPEVPKSAPKRGLPPEYKWKWGDAFSAALTYTLETGCVFKNKNELTRWIQEWFSQRDPDGNSPSPSITAAEVSKRWPSPAKDSDK